MFVGLMDALNLDPVTFIALEIVICLTVIAVTGRDEKEVI